MSAAPTAAVKAAAKAMGLETVFTAEGAEILKRRGYETIGEAVSSTKPEGPQSWLSELASYRDRLANYKIGEYDLTNAKSNARLLDPDLASSRSISPSAAYAIQVQRNIDRIVRNDKNWIRDRIAYFEQRLREDPLGTAFAGITQATMDPSNVKEFRP